MEDPVVNGQPYSYWVSQLHDWKRNPAKHEDVPKSVKEAGVLGLDVLKHYLGKAGVPSKDSPDSSDSDPSERNRANAMRAVEILKGDAAPLLPFLLEQIQERGWKGREFAVIALIYISPQNTGAYEIAKKDIDSADRDTRRQAIQILREFPKKDEALDLLLKATDDQEQTVREWAIGSLKPFLHQEKASAKLNQILADASRSDNDHVQAEWVLDPEGLKRKIKVKLPLPTP
jgi:hypothetical protein